MTLRFDADVAEYAQTVRSALAEGSDAEAAWKALCSLGAIGLGIPSELGGADGAADAVAAVMEVLGERIVEGPLLYSTIWAAQTILAAPLEPGGRDVVAGVADGSVRVALGVVGSDAGWWATEPPGLSAERVDGGWQLSGRHDLVLGSDPTRLLVLAATPGGPALFVVAPDAAGCDLRVEVLLDGVTRLSSLSLSRVSGELVVGPEHAERAVAAGIRAAVVASAAAALGGAARCLAITVEHARTREQFGSALGSFQAVKHRLVDVGVQIECARSALFLALAGGSADGPVAAAYASSAKAWCSSAYDAAAAAAVQLHGAIGFSEEHAAPHHFTRATVTRALLGSPEQHMARVADLLGL